MEEKTLKPLVVKQVKQITRAHGREFIINNEFVLGGVIDAELKTLHHNHTFTVVFDLQCEDDTSIEEDIIEKIESGYVS